MTVVTRHLSDDLACQVDNGRPIRNETTGTLSAGTLVYISSWDEDAQRWLVTKADADSARATLVLRDDIVNNGNGYAYKTHTLKSCNTNGSTVGNPVYLDTATAGSWTLNIPSATKVQQVVGRVRVVSATVGVIEIDLDATAPQLATLEIPDGGVAGGDIANSVISTQHFAAGGIPAGAIANSVISSNHVVLSGLNNGCFSNSCVDSRVLSADAVKAANISDSAVSSEHLALSCVGSAQLSADAVKAANISDSQVSSEHMALSCIGSAQLSADAVKAANISDSQVSSEHLALSCVGSAQLSADAVKAANISDSQVSSEHLALSCVGSAQLSADAVKAANISDSAVSSEHLALGIVGSAQLSADAVKAANISDSQVSSEHLALSCIGSAQVVLGALQPAQVGWVQPVYLGMPGVSSTDNVWTNTATLLSNSSGVGSSYAPQTQMDAARNLIYCLIPSTETALDWTAGGVTVSGYDILRNAITETMAATHLCTASEVHGDKCFNSVVYVSYNLSMADSLTGANTAGASLKIGAGSKIGFPQSIGDTGAIVGLRVGTLPTSDFTVINSSLPYAAVQFAASNTTTPCYAQVVMSKL